VVIKELLTHRAVSGDRHSSALSQLESIVALVGLGVCDGAHRLDVMKKVRGPIAEVKTPAASHFSKTAARGVAGFLLEYRTVWRFLDEGW
jgi:hypothetical protein